ncbi:hypothetical protein CGCS363_v014664 [Colletotrichum siamense]|uniref:uncharacterized protein n=1 Tax=Colletotrichum siamense TaxID=690259 RepID=UPI001872DE12|nr:uncharacterized protein CGCS363_v014664 [Colletotrichum siamense]KAF5485273.1 hypothetical protein CGCS363_v014664 [Colletotrichum siamense]
MNTYSMTAGGADNGANNNTNGAAKQRRRAKKAKRTKKAGSAIKSDRLKSLDLLQKIGLALKAKRDASSTDGQAWDLRFSFRGLGGIPPPATLADGPELQAWRLEHNIRWMRMTPREHVGMQQQVLAKIEGRPSNSGASADKRIPSRCTVLGKGGIRAPRWLSVDEREAWREAHNERWSRMSKQERWEMKQQQEFSDNHYFGRQADNNREVDAARQQKAPKTPAAQEGVHSVLTSKKRARSPEGSEALSDPFYHGLEEFISDEESAIMPPNRKRVRFNEPEPVAATVEPPAQQLESREATEADGPELGVAAEESPTSSLEVLELAEEPLAPRVFVTPNPKANQPVIRVVTMDAEQEFAQKIIDGDDTPVSYFDFGPDFQLSDLHIHEILLRRPSFFQRVVRITAGSPKIRLPLTDTGLVRLVTACPILEDLSINGGTHLSDRSVAAVISKCKNIRHLAFCGANFEPNNVCGAALHQLVGTSVATNLEEIVLKNTKVYEATVKRLRDELKISHSG